MLCRKAILAVLRVALTPAIVAIAAAGTLSGCGGRDATPPVPVADPGAVAAPTAIPDWFQSSFRPPAGSVLIEVINDPEPGLGKSLTWRNDGSFDTLTRDLERILASLGWKPTDRLVADRSDGNRRISWYIENGEVEVIRLFEDKSLKGVRLSVELPHA